ncbi:MAG: hypothetical protein GEU74_00230 [Nitriliruptorales bacterium]|nr:hypothetical protein [Nitriliruptorales bacterium]
MRACSGSYTPQGMSQCAWTSSGAATRSTMVSRRETSDIEHSFCATSRVSGRRVLTLAPMVTSGAQPGAAAVPGGVAGVLVMLSCMWWRGPCRVSVKGLSMAPTLLPGDHLLVRPVRRVRRGDMVVVRDPEAEQRWVVKRVAALPGESVGVDGRMLHAGEGLIVLGDNPGLSTDSRSYGTVPAEDVHGRVWYRYAPAPRAGRL